MSYENIGTPSGNNLYITIPLRGTQNWDQKLKDGFFVKVSEHDHTPGKGAAIVEAALDAALQTKVAQIATNTSEIAQNAGNITTNAANILTNANNISSNDTDITSLQNDMSVAYSNISNLQNDVGNHTNDINALDVRMGTAESNISSNDTDIAALDGRVTTLEANSYTITSSTNANTLLPSTLSNANVIVENQVPITINNKQFENVTFTLETRVNFEDCTLINCFIGDRGTLYSSSDVEFTNSTVAGTKIIGKSTVEVSHSNVYRSNITCEDITIDNTNATSIINFERNVVNLRDSFDVYGNSNSSYNTYITHNDIKCNAASFYSLANDTITIRNGRIDTLLIQTDAYYLQCWLSANIPTIICRKQSSSSTRNFKLRYGVTDVVNIINSSVPAFRLVGEVFSEYDNDITDLDTRVTSLESNKVLLGIEVVNTAAVNLTQEKTIIASSGEYDPGSNYNNSTGEFTIATAGNYIINFTCDFNTADTNIIRLYKGSSGTTLVRDFETDHKLVNGYQFINLAANEKIKLTAQTTSVITDVYTSMTIEKVN